MCLDVQVNKSVTFSFIYESFIQIYHNNKLLQIMNKMFSFNLCEIYVDSLNPLNNGVFWPRMIIRKYIYFCSNRKLCAPWCTYLGQATLQNNSVIHTGITSHLLLAFGYYSNVIQNENPVKSVSLLYMYEVSNKNPVYIILSFFWCLQKLNDC